MVKFLTVIILALVLGVGGFFVNEARKEIYFLCGNFSTDTPLDSVLKQLNTVKLSTYKILTLSKLYTIKPELQKTEHFEGSPQLEYQYAILLQSPLTFNRSNCQIHFQSNVNFDEDSSGNVSVRQISFQEQTSMLVVQFASYEGLF